MMLAVKHAEIGGIPHAMDADQEAVEQILSR